MKIDIFTDKEEFSYDIYSLVKAFCPQGDLKVFVKDEGGRGAEECYSLFEEEGRLSFYKNKDLLFSEEVKPGSERAELKNTVKSVIYKGLSGLLGPLPWGDLTGIRPTKIARLLKEEDKSDEEVLGYMKDTYFVSDEKSELALSIAKRELDILKPLRKGLGYSLYIGIPFCPTTCLYCSFTSNSIALWKNRVSIYLDALKKEIAFVADSLKDKVLDTVYIGGGTPTTLSPEELEDLLSYLESKLNLNGILEFTVEAGRADSITIEKLKVLKRHNVTRISVNPQTMNQETLDIIGRRHTALDVVRAFNDARSLGFNNINMDIILGLPGEGDAEVRKTIDDIVSLNPDSLTVHSLAVKRGSRMHERILEKGYEPMVNTDGTMKIAGDGAKRLNMVPYYLYRQKNMAGNFENVGYAKEGCFGIYNILIMEDVEPIVALGPGSVSKVITKEGTLERSDNVKDVALYIDQIDEMIERKRQLFALWS